MPLFQRILASLQLTLCSYCFRMRNRELCAADPLLDAQPGHIIAHHGGWTNELFSGPEPIPEEDISTWADDPEHGLFHGVCTAMLSGLAAKVGTTEDLKKHFQEPKPETFALHMAALLHDFVRGSGYDINNHDGRLALHFDKLPAIAYRHSNPASGDLLHPLILADRLELYRFGFADSWVEWDKVEDAVAACDDAALVTFEGIIRPALHRLFFWRNGVWLRHGAENRGKSIQKPDYDWSRCEYPQEQSYVNVRDKHKGSLGFSVEVGRGPFAPCIMHGGQYQDLQGLIPLKVYQRYGKLAACQSTYSSHAGGFDHPCCQGHAPLKEWLFLYRDRPENLYGDYVDQLIERGAMILPWEFANNWLTFTDMFLVRLLTLRT